MDRHRLWLLELLSEPRVYLMKTLTGCQIKEKEFKYQKIITALFLIDSSTIYVSVLLHTTHYS